MKDDGKNLVEVYDRCCTIIDKEDQLINSRTKGDSYD